MLSASKKTSSLSQATTSFPRAAPAVGARLVGLWLSRHSLERHVGMIMFAAVAGFGLATLVFALSTVLWLSLPALFALGAFDMVSMVIRAALVQLDTSDEMRGRVSAVNSIFINTSNQLGEFESGMLAAWLEADRLRRWEGRHAAGGRIIDGAIPRLGAPAAIG